MSDAPAAAPVRRRRFEWIRAASDRVPTRWFAAIATGAFLAATAAFGGLATAAPPERAELEPGETHVTDQRILTIQRAVLIDDLSETGVTVEPGQRVLALVADVENAWTQPVQATTLSSSFAVSGVHGRPAAARYDDSTRNPSLQPGVPATVVFAWPVDAGAFHGGESLSITLNTLSLYTGSFVTEGTWWDDPVADAVLEVPIEDVGAGADASE